MQGTAVRTGITGSHSACRCCRWPASRRCSARHRGLYRRAGRRVSSRRPRPVQRSVRAALPGAVEVELVVYAVVGEAEPALAAQPAMSVRLPGGASSSTPAAESCLAPGRYAWAVRGQSAGDDEVEGAAASASWSEALLFEVRERPTTQSSRTLSMSFAVTWRPAESWPVRLRLRPPLARTGAGISAVNRRTTYAKNWRAASRPTCPSASRALQARSRTWCWAARRSLGSRPRTSGESPTTPWCSTFTTPVSAP